MDNHQCMCLFFHFPFLPSQLSSSFPSRIAAGIRDESNSRRCIERGRPILTWPIIETFDGRGWLLATWRDANSGTDVSREGWGWGRERVARATRWGGDVIRIGHLDSWKSVTKEGWSLFRIINLVPSLFSSISRYFLYFVASCFPKITIGIGLCRFWNEFRNLNRLLYFNR